MCRSTNITIILHLSIFLTLVIYGDDGLDPAVCAGDLSPVDFAQFWRCVSAEHSGAKHGITDGGKAAVVLAVRSPTLRHVTSFHVAPERVHESYLILCKSHNSAITLRTH
jgi:hypothetical protein